MKNLNKGITLIELLIVITVISILGAVVVPKLLNASSNSKEALLQSQVKMINSQIELFYFTYGAYPTSMDNKGWTSTTTGANYVDFFPNGVPLTDTNDKQWGNRYDANTGQLSEN
ncbi:hypothetical protein DID76_02835 [Candidatus Marinamargulisbacteria bacterium SCGC AG-414-C22]|nr:hypothetical protein DID76_02835 [Candidatus Marinamargulisbacteria bacterium SCGC AG-414-C22]